MSADLAQTHRAIAAPRAATKAPRRISFVINSMEGGGAERAMANLLHHIAPLLGPEQQLELVLLDDRPLAQRLPEGLRVTTLDGRGKMLRSGVQLWRHFRRNRPNVCVSYLARANCLNVWLAALFGYRSVISERVQTTSHLATARAGALLRLITRLSYPRADAVVPVSAGVADDLAQNYGVARARMQVIGNPIDAEALQGAAAEAPEIALPDRYILGVGRLVVNKNFPMLLAAYARANPTPDLVILGEGPERAALEAQIAALSLGGRVHLPGFVDNPYPMMGGAEFVVSCSNAEGFPNTLIEAMTLGTPVIATDCPSGPAFVLRKQSDDGDDLGALAPGDTAQDGILVPMQDVAALARAMDVLAGDGARTDYAQRAAARASDFGIEDVVRQYMRLISPSATTVKKDANECN